MKVTDLLLPSELKELSGLPLPSFVNLSKDLNDFTVKELRELFPVLKTSDVVPKGVHLDIMTVRVLRVLAMRNFGCIAKPSEA